MSGFNNSYGNQGNVDRPTMGERIAGAIPGTDEYRMKHNQGMGMGGNTAGGMGGHHTHGHGGMGGMGGGDYNTGGMGGQRGMMGDGAQGHRNMGDSVMSHIPGTEQHRAEHMNTPGNYNSSSEHSSWSGSRDTHHGQHTGMGMSGAGTGTGTGYEGRETMGDKIMKHVPGTREHEMKQMAEGNI